MAWIARVSTSSYGRALALASLLLLPQLGFATPPLLVPELDRLQGEWRGEGPGGVEISITITGDSLHYHAREDFWYEATFVLPPDRDPRELHATIEDSAPPKKDIGHVVFAIYRIEGDRLTLAVDDGSNEPPASFPDASSHYVVDKVAPPDTPAGE